MDLNDTLKQFEAVEANLSKLERLWTQIKPLLPASEREASVTDEGKYIELQRSFNHIARGMPRVDGFGLDCCLLDPDEILKNSIDCLELGEISVSVTFTREVFRQGEVLAEYRFRVESKRRELARQSVESLSAKIEQLLQGLRFTAAELEDNKKMPSEEWDELKNSFKSIDALLGSSTGRAPRWGMMLRHISFGVRQDYDDIVKHDWPDVRRWLDRALYSEADPLPVTATDLGDLVRAEPQGPVSTELNWAVLSPTEFERLIFNLIDRTPGYINPKWLTHTNAPDRGRDLSVERTIEDRLAGTRTLRIILACKRVDSVNLPMVTELKEQMKLWEPPRIDELIIVSSGRFTTDAIDYVERSNRGTEAMRIEMWPSSHLERLLATRPELIGDFHLRS
ncbi:MAG: restriction endonuclease [Verrucomicrobia bacterium]|nr:MAG: restriction endonuclease [Verrucomicrobiota bacterium]